MFNKKVYVPIIIILSVCGVLGILDRIYGFNLKFILYAWIGLSASYIAKILREENLK